MFSNARDVLSRLLFQEIEDGETGTRLPSRQLLYPSRLLQNLTRTLGSYAYAGWNSLTVVCLVSQTMNANEAGSDPVVIQLPLCSPYSKTRLTAL